MTLGARRGQEPPGYPGAGAKDSCKPSSLSAENCSGSSVRSGRGLNHQVSSLLSEPFKARRKTLAGYKQTLLLLPMG